jgi:hypothetical protein
MPLFCWIAWIQWKVPGYSAHAPSGADMPCTARPLEAVGAEGAWCVWGGHHRVWLQ